MLNNRITIVCGHYGSGKTNFSVNLAVKLAQQGKNVTITDLDIVNPYFRTADHKQLFEQRNIELLAPCFANTNLDIPVLPRGLAAVMENTDKHVTIDVGGDDDGSVALGGYSAKLNTLGYEMLYVVNRSRYLADDIDEEVRLIRSIEHCSRLQITGLVNNTNLGKETTSELIKNSDLYMKSLSEKASLPIICTAVDKRMIDEFSDTNNLFDIEIYVKTPWE